MRKYIVILFMLIALPCFGADIHVCDTAVCGQTPGNGSTWSVALDDLPTNLTRGNTYWIADGNYAWHEFRDTESGETYITIKKATATAHGSATGWDNAFGDGQAIWGTKLLDTVNTDYELGPSFLRGFYVFDGVVGSGGDPDDYGFRINATDTTNAYSQKLLGLPHVGNAAYQLDHITISHTAIIGQGYETYGEATIGSNAIYSNEADGGESYNITLSNNYLANTTSNIMLRQAFDWVIRDNYFYKNWSSGSAHGQQISTQSTDRISLYNNIFKDGTIYTIGAHGLMETNSNWNFYNNLIIGGTSGVVAAESGRYNCITSSQFHHNTFVDTVCPAENCIDSGMQTDVNTTKSYAYNNLFFGVTRAAIGQYCGTTPTPGCVVHNNNAFLASTGYETTVADEANEQVDTEATNAIFTNYATGDYTIAAADQTAIDHIIGKGTTLASPYDIDYAGVTRTAPFDIGAYDVGGEADTTAPVTAEVTPVTASSPNQAPSYVFSSDEAGTVTYGGTCGNGSLSTAVVGNNTTSWALGIGTYSNCTITVTDAASNASTPLAITEFVITPTDSSAAKTIEGGVTFQRIP